MRKKNTSLVVLALVAVGFLFVVIILSGYRVVSEGEALVVKPHFWKGGTQVVVGGRVWAPSLLYRADVYPLREQFLPLQEHGRRTRQVVKVLSKDGMPFSVGYCLAYRLDSIYLPRIEGMWGKDYANKFIVPLVERELSQQTARRTASDMFRSRGDFARDVRDTIREKMAPAGIGLVSFDVTAMRPDRWAMFH